jgi:UDP-glucuronate 4-epimerase
MKPKKILITGCAGFLGFSIAKNLVENNFKVYGIDNLNSYYNVKLKRARLKKLKNRNFQFFKIDLTKKKELDKLKNKKIDLTIHLAAQPGVRYSFDNPQSYIQNNIVGFSNILNFAKENKLDLIYASSSSVYGDAKKYPVNESDKLNPKNLYAITKRNNEEMAELYSKAFKMKIIGLRFFTVFGEWGRPDMFILKYFECCRLKKKFPLYNNGNFFRDFTYIKDLVIMVKPLILKINKFKKAHLVLNICSSKPLNVKNILIKLSKLTKITLYKKSNPSYPEVYKTYGDNKKIKKISNISRVENIDKALKNTFDWYKNNIKLFK